jgi:hypothetical protein
VVIGICMVMAVKGLVATAGIMLANIVIMAAISVVA